MKAEVYFDRNDQSWVCFERPVLSLSSSKNALFSKEGNTFIPTNDPALVGSFKAKVDFEQWLFSLPKAERTLPSDLTKRTSSIVEYTEVELRRRRSTPFHQVQSTHEIAALLNRHFEVETLEQECFWVVCLDVRGNILSFAEIARGGVSNVSVDPKVFGAVLCRSMASKVVVAHNHPSGYTTPSESDDKMTERLAQVASLLNVFFEDHLVLSGDGFFSYRSNKPEFVDAY